MHEYDSVRRWEAEEEDKIDYKIQGDEAKEDATATNNEIKTDLHDVREGQKKEKKWEEE